MNHTYAQYVESKPEDNPLNHWQNGGVVVIPTETVYGLAADATNDQAVAKIYALKDRPRFNPLIAHVSDAAMAMRYVQWNAQAQRLATAFWPGPLTLVLPLLPQAGISSLATDGGDTLGVRVPAHDLTRNLIGAFGKPLVAPSANKSGRISPTCADHVRAEFAGACPLVIDGGACTVGIESTVLDVSGGQPLLLRPGAVTKEMIEEVLHIEVHLFSEMNKGAQLKSPGLLARHYAPATPLRLNATNVEDGEALLAFGADILVGATHVFNLSESGNVEEAASRLFHALRLLDGCGASCIAVMQLPETGIGAAIADRLRRASVAA